MKSRQIQQAAAGALVLVLVAAVLSYPVVQSLDGAAGIDAQETSKSEGSSQEASSERQGQGTDRSAQSQSSASVAAHDEPSAGSLDHFNAGVSTSSSATAEKLPGALPQMTAAAAGPQAAGPMAASTSQGPGTVSIGDALGATGEVLTAASGGPIAAGSDGAPSVGTQSFSHGANGSSFAAAGPVGGTVGAAGVAPMGAAAPTVHALGVPTEVQPVPEPGTWALIAAGLVVMVSIVRRRRVEH